MKVRLIAAAAAATLASAVQIPFGHGLRSEFLLDANYTNLNHGSYGACPSAVLEAESSWRRAQEERPDVFFRYQLYDSLDKARECVAKYLGCDEADVVLIDNASAGMNALLQSLAVGPVLYLDLAYFMVQETLRYLRDVRPGVVTFLCSRGGLRKGLRA